MKDTADAVAFVIVKRLLIDTHDAAIGVEHQVLANQATGIGKAIRKLLASGKQKQARGFRSVGADYDSFSFLQMRAAFLVKINCSDGAPAGVEFDFVNVRVRADLTAAGALRHANRSSKGT